MSDYRITVGENAPPYPTNRRTNMDHTEATTPGTRAGRQNMSTILREAAVERNVSVREMEDRFAEAFLAVQPNNYTYGSVAEAISTVLNLAITPAHVRRWMIHYGHQLATPVSKTNELETLRAKVAEIANEGIALRQENVELRKRLENAQALLSDMRDIAHDLGTVLTSE